MASLQQTLAFIKTLKQNFPNFETFAQELVDFREGNTDSATMVSRISELLHGRPDLIAAFNNYLPENNRLPIPSAGQPTQNFVADIPIQLPLKRRRQVVKDAVEFVNKVGRFSKDDQVYTSFLRIVTDFETHRNIVRVDKEMSDLFEANPGLYTDFTWFAADSWPDDGEKEGVGVSYPRKVAKKVPACQKTLEECEDHLYDSDMAFHRLESTLMATEKLQEEICERGNGDGEINLEDYYSAMNQRCIKEIQVEGRKNMMERLRTNPTAESQVLLRLVNEKLEKARVARELNAKRLRNCYKRNEHNQHRLYKGGGGLL